MEPVTALIHNRADEGAVAITRATLNGDPMETAEIFKVLRPNAANVPRSLESTHLAIATLRRSFTDVLAKIDAGGSSSSMGVTSARSRSRPPTLEHQDFRMP
jgi:hypothetical protein